MRFFSLLCTAFLACLTSGQDEINECNGLINEFYQEAGSDGVPFWLRWTMNINSMDSSMSTLTMQYEVAKQSWVGFGVAATEEGKMEGAQVVIGTPEDGAVLKYDLFTYGATPMANEKQTLMNASIVQDDLSTILTYTKYLEEEGEIPILPGMVVTLGATGINNTLGYHGPGRGGGAFPLFPDCIDGVKVAAEMENSTATTAPEDEEGDDSASKATIASSMLFCFLTVNFLVGFL